MRFLEKLYDVFRYDIPRFFENIYVQRKALWNARWYGHSGVCYYLRQQIDHMSKMQRKHGWSVSTSKECDRMDVLVKVLDRLIADEYCSERWAFDDTPSIMRDWKITPKYDFPKNRANIYKVSERQQYIDKEYLFDELKKRLHHW